MMKPSEPSLTVMTSTEARKNFAEIISRARAGEDIGIGSGGVAAVRLTKDVDQSGFNLPQRVFSVMLHALAGRDAHRIAASKRAEPKTVLTHMSSNASGDVFYWVLDHPNPWWARDYVLTLLFALRRIEKDEDLELTTLDELLTGLMFIVPDDTANARERLFGDFRAGLADSIRYLAASEADEILTAVE